MDNDVIKLCECALVDGVEMRPVTQRIGVLMNTRSVLMMGGQPSVVRTSSIEWIDNTACCAGLMAGGYGGISKDAAGVEAIVSVSQRGSGRALVRAEAVQFYDILINHTPYGECIVSKDPEYAYNFGLIIDTNYPSNIIAGCLMAQRLAWEYVNKARSAIHYANLGVNKSLAFLLGHTFSNDGGDITSSGHCCIDSSLVDKTYIKNFIKGKAQPDELYSVQKTYKYNVHSTWQSGKCEFDENGYAKEKRLGLHINAIVADYAVNNKAVARVPNPFAKSFTLTLDGVTDSVVVAYFKENLDGILGDAV